LCASDFTHMKSLAVTIGSQPFDHLVYHFVLTYSNWESVTIQSCSARLLHRRRAMPSRAGHEDDRRGEKAGETNARR
jgi:hypothetical protein